MKFIILLFVLAQSLSCMAMEVEINPSMILNVDVPDGFRIEKRQSPYPGQPPSTDVTSGSVKMKFSTIPIPIEKLIEIGGVKNLLPMVTRHFKSGAVDKLALLKQLDVNGGQYVQYTDAAMVGKESRPGRWSKVTAGMMVFNDQVLYFTLFSHSFESLEYKALMKMANQLTVVSS